MRLAHENSVWGHRIPIIVGICGKRYLDDTDATNNHRLMAIAEEKIRKCFDKIERQHQNSPIIVLSGGALGIDLLATKVALSQGSRWRAVLALPLEPGLMQQDFVAQTPEWSDL